MSEKADKVGDDRMEYQDMSQEQKENLKTMQRIKVSGCGRILSIIFFALVVACIALIAIQLRTTDSRWSSKSPFKAISVMQIVHVCIAFITCILALTVFIGFSHKSGCIMLVRIKIYYFSFLFLISLLYFLCLLSLYTLSLLEV
ncbi:MAG: hypothetical protein MJ252_20810 [archaeon]|nr:hypothetical protein [archaeon]